MIQANLIPRAKEEPNKVDNLKDVQYSCGCAKFNGQVVALCPKHSLSDFQSTRAPRIQRSIVTKEKAA